MCQREIIMKNIILVVEDEREEQVIAKDLILNDEKKIIIADTLKGAENFIEKFSEKLYGIITDMHFPIESDVNAEGANGLSVVLRALQREISCVVCTDDVAHNARYITMALERLEKVVNKSIPISANKNWEDALQKLKSIGDK